MPHPHDALFKSAFETPGSAAALVRPLVPAAIRDAICWDTMTGERGSFVDAVLAEHHGDLVFSARLRGQHAGRVFLLLEHQSTQDTAMTLRTLTYQTRIWNLVRKCSSTSWLSPVLSVVVSHAPGGWTSARAFAGMFDPWVLALPEMAALVPQFSLIVDDLTEHSNAALQARPLAAYPRLVLWLLRDGRDPVRLLDSFDAWRGAMLEVEQSPEGAAALETLLLYLFRVMDPRYQDPLRAKLRELGTRVQGAVMTIAEHLHEEGRLAALRSLLAFKFKLQRLDERYDAHLQGAPPEAIDRYLQRVLTADSLAQVFDD